MKKILIHAWTIHKKENKYYLPYTHWIYLKEIVKYYDEVVLLSPCRNLKTDKDYSSLEVFDNVFIKELPPSQGYISAIKYFFKYRRAYEEIKDVTTYYARYPIPFGWLQKVYGKKARRIIHYVGDPIDVTKNNPNFSNLKKKILISAFKPENMLYNWACKRAEIFTNGYHIAERLDKNNIKATTLISSTLIEKDFFFEEKKIDPTNVSFVYLGYLRKAKGVETVIRSFGLYQNIFHSSKLTIIGAGEFENELKKICKIENIKNITFLGHIDDRIKLNELLRRHDVFLFASLSEGSPRVILEAMANGLAVISTPVGSLPKVFEDKKEILFAEFNKTSDFLEKMISLLSDNGYYSLVRKNGNNKVKKYTITNFIKTIFYED
ncbi:MAG: glycosyltransferase family 4 protein [Endomicrobium sp.]|jgi:glycosyltransferase involved in cell wall biosynthesis|nr:glycosyltransferase family 4 protein [Endomicrobium sp.]